MKRLLFFLLFVLLLMPAVYAEEASLDVSAVEEGLPPDVREISGELVTDGSYDMRGAIARLAERMKREVIERTRCELRELTRIVAIAVICAVAEAVCGEGRAAEILSLCACAAVVILTVGSLDGLAAELTEGIRKLCDYARAALPAIFTASAVSGAVISAGAKYAAVNLCLNIMMETLQRITLPLIYAYLALCISRCFCPNAVLNASASTLKWVCVTVMSVLTMGVGAYISLTGALTGGADALAVKGTRTVIAGVLPVVGGILSDAASVVLASASLIKSSAGAFALVGVSALCLAPFAAIGVKMLLFRLCAAIASAAEGKRLAMLLGDLSAALGMMLGMLGAATIMLFISFMAAIRTVSA
ncbi:MAG: hypothetical protein IJH48_08975 [Oscillospiraceae bacterium]|nr:hypothetical protein [Oscillospiraceae bacterium]